MRSSLDYAGFCPIMRKVSNYAQNYAAHNRIIPRSLPCSLLIVSAVTLIVREQTPLFATDISAFLSCAGFVRCPTLITALTVPQVGRDYSVLICVQCGYAYNCAYSYKNRLCHTWRSIRFLFPIIPVPHFPVSHFQRPRSQ